jgi:hypothetical protein
MYVTIDSDLILDKRDIVGIFDIDKLTVYKSNRTYLSNLEKRGKIVSNDEKLPKSFIVCDKKGEEEVYISPFLSSTLIKRQ